MADKFDVISYSTARKEGAKAASGFKSATTTQNADESVTLTINWNNGTSSNLNFSAVKGADGNGIKDITVDSNNHLMIELDDSTIKDCGEIPQGSGSGTTDYIDLTNKPSINGVELDGDKSLADFGIINYDDTAIKSDITDLQTDKQDKTDNTLDTTDKTVVGAINEVNGALLDTVGFSADYKNIILNRMSGLNPYTIPISSIIHNAKLQELFDVDTTDIGNGKTLIYNSATGKHEYVNSSSTDELVKMDASSDAKYLGDLIDKTTIINDNGKLVAKSLDGLTTSITELNYIKGLQMPVQDLVTAFANGGLKTIDAPFPTYADLQTYDVSTLLDDIRYLVRVLADETHGGKITAYLIKKGQTAPTFYGYLSDSRDFSTNPIDLATEVAGKLKAKNIDSDDLFALLTLSSVYKTLTTKDEIFGTHGAKAMYDELVADIGNKADSTDLTTHTSDTDIHVSTTEKDTWNTVTDKASKSDLTSHTGDSVKHITSAERTSWNGKVNKTDIIDNLTSIDTDKPLSANQGKVLKGEVDSKANKTEVVKKTAITTTINSASTDSQVPSAKSVYDNAIKCNNIKTYYTLAQLGIDSTKTCTIKDIWDKMPVNSIGVIDTNSSIVTDLDYFKPALNITDSQNVYGFLTIGKFIERTILEFRRSHSESAIIPETFIGYCIGKNCTSIDWKQIVITNIDNTPIKTLVNSSDINSSAVITYMVKKGICTVSANTVSSSKMASGNITLTTGLPIPANPSCWYSLCTNSNATNAPVQNLLVRIDVSGNLISYIGTNSVNYFGTFSYPVK
jgi:hypothetical protein